MTKKQGVRLYERRLIVAALVACVSGEVSAGFVGKGDDILVRGPGGVPQLWRAPYGGRLSLEDGAKALSVVAYGATVSVSQSQVSALSGIALFGSRGTDFLVSGSQIESADNVAVSLLHLAGGEVFTRASRLRVASSKISGQAGAVDIDGHGNASIVDSKVISTGEGSDAVLLGAGSLQVSGRSRIHGVRSGITVYAGFDAPMDGDGRVSLTNSTVSSDSGPAIRLESHSLKDVAAAFVVSDHSWVGSASGQAVHVERGGDLDLTVARSTIDGSVVLDDKASARAILKDEASLRGAIRGHLDLTVASGSTWLSDQDSSLRTLSLSGGTIGFTESEAPTREIRVSGDVEGSGGDVHLRASLSPAVSTSDRLTIDGSLRTDAPLRLFVTASGQGGPTDTNGNGRADPDEGLSLVQVAGKASADAVQLANGYVMAGPYQYALYAWGPTDGHADNGWDFKLASRMVTEGAGDDSTDSPDETVDPGKGSGDKARPAVTPEIPAYLSASSASLSYADSMTDGLHQRMGELRDSDFAGDVGTEWFLRQHQAKERYTSNRSFSQYGYNFDQSADYVQFGGSLVALDGDNGALRAGWAIDHGTTAITPRAVDGYSVTRLKSNGFSAWLTWKHGTGLWVDTAISSHRLRGGTDTAVSGRQVSKQSLAVGSISAEMGFPITLSPSWTIEPRALAAYRSVSINKVAGRNGLAVDGAHGSYGRYSAGISLIRHDEKFTPYARVNVEASTGRGVAIKARANDVEAQFVSGAPGASYVTSAGFSVRLGERIRMFGESAYRHYIGRGGFQGWSTNMGLRMTL
ncbi:autotransporter outer membrane beta-barrel domain-containing protein [Luteibacter yeojuensis]|uniref:Autotransporter domain-containing protein n=1 Tax=Luteibacter yeojuensis TaxID=345309 RepID=A0A0F3KJY2_9GAMM|nr:autotransporter outer membrane beta-barrel domain-containing protein [Luteibacter yeojuensis]KJV30424.1 hypothetical protein VI08_15050 [Luteibacter yeojuensis]